jgi:hypothetical protein
MFMNITPDTKENGKTSGSSSIGDAGPTESAPAPAIASGPLLGDGVFTGMNNRRVQSVEMIGAVTEREGGAPASVKTWKYGLSPTGERTFDQVLYIESSHLTTDEATGLITAPEAGTGLVFDAGKRAPVSSASGSSTPGSSTSDTGDTRFKWKKKLTYNQTTGELRMLQDVELEHMALGGSDKLTLKCGELAAMMNVQKGTKGEGGKLLSAVCSGGALAQSGTQLLTADDFTYDAVSDVLTAESKSETPAMLNDTRKAAPVLAKKLRWERKTDRIEVLEMMPVTGPMNK